PRSGVKVLPAFSKAAEREAEPRGLQERRSRAKEKVGNRSEAPLFPGHSLAPEPSQTFTALRGIALFFSFYLFQKGRASMQTVTLGRTGITVNKNGFGALPIQRVSAEYAGMLLRKAYNAGITYFDTARSYSDSEEKMGLALSG